jgi:hypothetical protein
MATVLFIVATFVEQANDDARTRMAAGGNFWPLSRAPMILDLSDTVQALFSDRVY